MKKLKDFYKKYYKKFLFLIIMTTTRKEIITRNYLMLTNALSEFVDSSLFPSLEDLDIISVIQLFSFFFPRENDDQEYISTIKILINERGIVISDDDFIIVSNLIIDFINFLNKDYNDFNEMFNNRKVFKNE